MYVLCIICTYIKNDILQNTYDKVVQLFYFQANVVLSGGSKQDIENSFQEQTK